MRAADLLEPQAHRYLARDQYTVPQHNQGYAMLGPRGQELLAKVQAKIANNQYDGEFRSYRWISVASGSWWAPDGEVDPHWDLRGIIQTYFNRAVSGRLLGQSYDRGARTTTSAVVLHGVDWAYTHNDRLYKLNRQKPGADMPMLITTDYEI